MKENVRNGNIFIQLEATYDLKRTYRTRYLPKTDLQKDASFYTFLPNLSGE